MRFRYDGIAWAVRDVLDGDWSYEDAHASYVPVGRPENRHQAAEVGAFILEDLLHWALARKPRDRRAIVIVDEFSKLSARPGAAVDLVERARASGVGVVLIGQTWASIGPDETIRSRLAGTVGTVIIHQLKQPDEVAALAGTKRVMERTEQTHVLDHTGLGSQRAGNQYVVHPDEVRSLRRGEAYLIHGGTALRSAVRGAPVPASVTGTIDLSRVPVTLQTDELADPRDDCLAGEDGPAGARDGSRSTDRGVPPGNGHRRPGEVGCGRRVARHGTLVGGRRATSQRDASTGTPDPAGSRWRTRGRAEVIDVVDYMPILSGKAAEYEALGELTLEARTRTRPLIEVTPLTFDQQTEQPAKSLEEHVARDARFLRECWGAPRQLSLLEEPAQPSIVLIDVRNVETAATAADGRHAVTLMHELLGHAGVCAVPVTSFDRTGAHQDAVARIAAEHGVWLRLDRNQWADPAQLAGDVLALMGELALEPHAVDIVIDLGAIGEEDARAAVLMARGALQALPAVHEWRSVVVAGSSFPASAIVTAPVIAPCCGSVRSQRSGQLARIIAAF